MINIEHLKFPIGKYDAPKVYSLELLKEWISEIASFPKDIAKLTTNLSVEELNWKYRPNGWTIKQVVHHCADSHMNAFIRFKLALTEDIPIIRPYLEDNWAELSDSLSDDISDSLLLLQGLHAKWSLLLKKLILEELLLEYVHPEHGKKFTIQESIGSYAWHGKHHLAHIVIALENKGNKFDI